jgi:hypothetical protein
VLLIVFGNFFYLNKGAKLRSKFKSQLKSKSREKENSKTGAGKSLFDVRIMPSEHFVL